MNDLRALHFQVERGRNLEEGDVKRLALNQEWAVENKRSLTTPALKRLGTLKQLTRAKGGTGNDGGIGGHSMA